MSFDDPIYLDRTSLELLMDDTDQHRICWMYHDVLSDPKIAWMFDRYAGKGTPMREAWTTMAWVAAAQQEDSFYLLFKWYADFYGPPQRGDLYLVERDQGPGGELRVRYLNMYFQHKLGPQGRAWCASFLGRVSQNASGFFGETDFESNVVGKLIRVLEINPGRELEAFDRYLKSRDDLAKGQQCATISAYFQAVQAVGEIIYDMVVTDGGETRVHHMHARELLEILNRISDETTGAEDKRIGQTAEVFRELSGAFLPPPLQAPHLSRTTGRAMMSRTEEGLLRWLRVGGNNGRRLLRELYWRVAPDRVWDVFHRWQGEVFFTVVRRPIVRGMPRGVYLLARFEDQTGMDVTDLFWLENLSVATIHLCEGEFFDELMDQLLEGPVRDAAMAGGGWQAGDFTARTIVRLKQAFDRTVRGLR